MLCIQVSYLEGLIMKNRVLYFYSDLSSEIGSLVCSVLEETFLEPVFLVEVFVTSLFESSSEDLTQITCVLGKRKQEENFMA